MQYINPTSWHPQDVAQALVAKGHRLELLPPGKKTYPRKGYGINRSHEASYLWEAFERTPDANLALIMGREHMAVDLDVKNGVDGVANFVQWVLANDADSVPFEWGTSADHFAMQTFSQRTPTGGHHLIFTVPEGRAVKSLPNWLPGVDIRWGNAYVVAAGSKTEKGVYTVWENMAPAEAPLALLDALKKDPKEALPPGGVDPLPKTDATQAAIDLARERWGDIFDRIHRLANLPVGLRLDMNGQSVGWDMGFFFLAMDLVRLSNTPTIPLTRQQAREAWYRAVPREVAGHKWQSALEAVGDEPDTFLMGAAFAAEMFA